MTKHDDELVEEVKYAIHEAWTNGALDLADFWSPLAASVALAVAIPLITKRAREDMLKEMRDAAVIEMPDPTYFLLWLEDYAKQNGLALPEEG